MKKLCEDFLSSRGSRLTQFSSTLDFVDVGSNVLHASERLVEVLVVVVVCLRVLESQGQHR